MVAHLQITYDPLNRRASLSPLACLPVYIAQIKRDGQNAYRVVDTENAQAVSQLDQTQQEAAQEAARRVRAITGQSDREDEGQG